MLAKYLALLVSTAKALPTPPPERCTGPDCLSVSLPPFAQGGANTFLGGVPPLHNILLSIDHPELCQHGQPYDLFGKSCNGLAMFVTPPNCAELAPEEQLTQACVSSLTPPNASIVGGDALGKSIDIRTETRMREVIESSTKAEGNGYGVTAKGSLHFLQSGHTTRTSAVLGTEAVAMHVRHQTLFNPHLLRLTEYFKRMFHLGPAAWNSAQFSHFFVTGIFYGGYFSGTCVMTSKTEDRNKAFEVAAEIKVESASGSGGGASSSFSQKRDAYEKEVKFDCRKACSPSTCLPGPYRTLDAVRAGLDQWYAGLQQYAEAESVSVGYLRDNQELSTLFSILSRNNSSPWYGLSYGDIFNDPNSVQFETWSQETMLSRTEEDELRALKDLASGPVSDALHYVLQDMELQRSRIDSFTHEQLADQLSRVVGRTTVLTQIQSLYAQGQRLVVHPQPTAGWDYSQINGFGKLEDACAVTGSDSCTWSGFFSEENRWSAMTGAPVAGMHCSGHHCDDKRVLFYPHAPIDRNAYAGDWHASGWSPMVSTDHNHEMHCSNFMSGNAYVTQLQCHGDQCNNIQFRCQTAEYVYLDSDRKTKTGKISNDGRDFSTRTAAKPGSHTRNHATCAEGSVVTGLTCHSENCAEIELYCTPFVYKKPGVAVGQCINDADRDPSGADCCLAGTESARVPLTRVCRA